MQGEVILIENLACFHVPRSKLSRAITENTIAMIPRIKLQHRHASMDHTRQSVSVARAETIRRLSQVYIMRIYMYRDKKRVAIINMVAILGLILRINFQIDKYNYMAALQIGLAQHDIKQLRE